MKLKGKMFIDAEKAGIPLEALPLFFTVREMIRSNEDGRSAVARRELADTFAIPEWKVRSWLTALYKAGWLIAEKTRSRKYSMVRLGIPQNIPQNIPQKRPKNSTESKESIPQNIPQISPTGVSCSSVVSSAFDVVDSGLKKEVRHGSERSAPSPADQQRIEKETAWVREVLFKDCPLYQSDVKLNMIDERGSPWVLTLHRSWKAAYPAVDVMAEIKRAHVWELSNKERRKKNRARFLSNWLAKEQERGGIFKNGAVTRDRKPDRRYDADMPRELPAAIPSRSDPSDAEYEANRQAILVDIEARKAREREELPV